MNIKRFQLISFFFFFFWCLSLKIKIPLFKIIVIIRCKELTKNSIFCSVEKKSRKISKLAHREVRMSQKTWKLLDCLLTSKKKMSKSREKNCLMLIFSRKMLKNEQFHSFFTQKIPFLLVFALFLLTFYI